MEEKDPDPVYSADKRKPIFRRDRHLQSALSHMRENWNNKPALKREHIALRKDVGKTTILASDTFIHWALSYLYHVPANQHHNKALARHIKVTNDAANIVVQDYCSINEPPVVGPIPDLLRGVFTLKQTLSKITYRITFSEAHIATYSFLGCKATCYGNLHAIWPSDQFVFILLTAISLRFETV